MKNTSRLLFSFIIVLFLSSCTRTLQPDPGTQGVMAFIPPTHPVPTATPLPTINAILLANPTPTITCQDVLTFIKDVTIPDGSIVKPGDSLDKQWEVENNGSCNWETGYTIRLIGGDAMGADSIQDLFPARSGTKTTIRIVFTAPEEQGNYRSAWQAYNPEEVPFGDPFYIDISVSDD